VSPNWSDGRNLHLKCRSTVSWLAILRRKELSAPGKRSSAVLPVSAHTSSVRRWVTPITWNLGDARMPPFDPKVLATLGPGKSRITLHTREVVFSQGDPADAVFYIDEGKIELKVVSPHGKEAVLAILGVGEFVGEGSLAGQPLRMATATAATDCSLMRIEKSAMIELLRNESAFSTLFVSYLVTRNIRIEENLVDQLFNSSEKRLARLLLLLANVGREGKPEPVIPRVSQETLAEMIGTTRSRVSFFMNKFRRLGFIEYNGGLSVNRSLLTVVLHD
jgi:CRP/FNR family cyclic AMP-dependent transcriptional regulator